MTTLLISKTGKLLVSTNLDSAKNTTFKKRGRSYVTSAIPLKALVVKSLTYRSNSSTTYRQEMCRI